MTIQFKYKATLKWDNRSWHKILAGLQKGLVEATKLYEKEIIRELRRNVGSVAVAGFAGKGKRSLRAAALAGNLRKRVRHSAPGEAPYAQTFNLVKSVQSSFNLNPSNRLMRGRISTSVRYAKTLERGGALSVPERQKKFTSIRLINPLKTTPVIAPRPAWIPVFLKNERKMLSIIKKHGKLRV